MYRQGYLRLIFYLERCYPGYTLSERYLCVLKIFSNLLDVF